MFFQVCIRNNSTHKLNVPPLNDRQKGFQSIRRVTCWLDTIFHIEYCIAGTILRKRNKRFHRFHACDPLVAFKYLLKLSGCLALLYHNTLLCQSSKQQYWVWNGALVDWCLQFLVFRFVIVWSEQSSSREFSEHFWMERLSPE